MFLNLLLPLAGPVIRLDFFDSAERSGSAPEMIEVRVHDFPVLPRKHDMGHFEECLVVPSDRVPVFERVQRIENSAG